MNEEDKKVRLKDNSILINNLLIEDINTYKIIDSLSEDKREDFIKKAVIIHELGHRILYKRLNIKVESLEIHKALFLVLYDLYVDLYGEKFAKEIVEWDCSLPRNYKEAWNWALSFDRTERIIEFKKLLK